MLLEMLLSCPFIPAFRLNFCFSYNHLVKLDQNVSSFNTRNRFQHRS